MDFPSGFIPFFIQIITRISGFHTCARTHSGSPPPPGLPLPSKLNWHSPHTPPGLVPPPSTPSKSNLHGKPCQNRHTFENFSKIFDFFDFLCTGPAPTTPAPPAHSAQALAPPAHPSAHLRSLCTPSTHLPCTHAHFALHLPALSPLSNFLFNLRPPSGYYGQPSPSATGHSAHFRTSV